MADLADLGVGNGDSRRAEQGSAGERQNGSESVTLGCATSQLDLHPDCMGHVSCVKYGLMGGPAQPRTASKIGSMKYRTTIRQAEGSPATGIEIPDEVLTALGAGRKPAVKLSVNGYSYRSTVATVDGRYMVSFSSNHRAASGLGGGDEVEVEIEVDNSPREIDMPSDFAAALDAEPAARATFDGLSNSLKRYHVDLVNSAKTEETRQRRIDKSVATLREGKPR